MSFQTITSSTEPFPLPGTPTEIIERILHFAFGCGQLSTPFSPPTPLQNTSHLLLVSKAITEISLPLFYHSITILRARDWITFFDPRTGIFVVGADVERKKSWVKELRINMQKDARIPVALPSEDENTDGFTFTSLFGFGPRLVPLEEVTFPNLRHVCLFLTKLPKEGENYYGSGDSRFRALTMGEIQRNVDSDDEGSFVSNGSYQMDKDWRVELIGERSTFFRSLIYPLHNVNTYFFRPVDPNVPRLDTFRTVALCRVGSIGEARIESTYPFPCENIMDVDPIPRVFTIYAFPTNEENDRILAITPETKRANARPREDLAASRIREVLRQAKKSKESVERIEFVGFSAFARKDLVDRKRTTVGIERVFWEEEDGSVRRAVTDEDIASEES